MAVALSAASLAAANAADAVAEALAFADDAAMAAVDRAVADGADIVDIGGVKAGSKGEHVDTAEEVRRCNR